jgi:hypothetical protein
MNSGEITSVTEADYCCDVVTSSFGVTVRLLKAVLGRAADNRLGRNPERFLCWKASRWKRAGAA